MGKPNDSFALILNLIIFTIAGPVCLLTGIGIYFNHDVHMLRASGGDEGLCRITYVGHVDQTCNGDKYSRRCDLTFLLKFVPENPSFPENEQKQNIPLGWNSTSPDTVRVGDLINCRSKDFSHDRVIVYPWRHLSTPTIGLFAAGSVLTFIFLLCPGTYFLVKACLECRRKLEENRRLKIEKWMAKYSVNPSGQEKTDINPDPMVDQPPV